MRLIKKCKSNRIYDTFVRFVRHFSDSDIHLDIVNTLGVPLRVVVTALTQTIYICLENVRNIMKLYIIFETLL